MADRIGAGFVPVRKVGKLPHTTFASATSSNTAPTASRCTATRSSNGQTVLIVDDLLATGGTARATVDLVRKLGGDVHAVAVLIELAFLNGRAKLPGKTCARCCSTELGGSSRRYTRNVFSVMTKVWRIRPRRRRLRASERVTRMSSSRRRIRR